MGLRELMKVLLLDEAKEAGEVEGRSKGMAEAKVSIVKSLLTKTGFSLKKIADIVGEDFDFVLRVKNEMDAVGGTAEIDVKFARKLKSEVDPEEKASGMGRHEVCG